MIFPSNIRSLQGEQTVARPKRREPPSFKNLVGARVRSARLAHQPPLDQADLAASLSMALNQAIGRTTVTRLEKGDRPVTDIELVALAKILDVDVAWLLHGEEST